MPTEVEPPKRNLVLVRTWNSGRDLPKPRCNHFPKATKQRRNKPGLVSSRCQRGLKMIALEFIAAVLGAGVLVTLLSKDFSSELLLAIVSCLS